MTDELPAGVRTLTTTDFVSGGVEIHFFRDRMVIDYDGPITPITTQLADLSNLRTIEEDDLVFVTSPSVPDGINGMWRAVRPRMDALSVKDSSWRVNGQLVLVPIPVTEDTTEDTIGGPCVVVQESGDPTGPKLWAPLGFEIGIDSSVPPDMVKFVDTATGRETFVALPTATPSGLPRLVMLNGLPGVGKDTIARYLVENWGYTQIAFADQVKRDVEELMPFIAHQVNRRIDEQGVHGDDTPQDQDGAWRRAWDAYKAVEPVARQKQQEYAEMVKDRAGQHVWGQVVAKQIDALWTLDPEARFVISDLRFPAEEKAIQAMLTSESHHVDPVTVVVSRPGITPGDHVSEQWMPSHQIALANDGTLQQLHERLIAALATRSES